MQTHWTIISKHMQSMHANVLFTNFALQLAANFARAQSAMQGVALEMSRFQENLRALADGVLTPLALPPGRLRQYLRQVKSNLKPYP